MVGRTPAGVRYTKPSADSSSRIGRIRLVCCLRVTGVEWALRGATIVQSLHHGCQRRRSSPRIAAHRQLIDRAHARGITVIGATLTPYEGANYWSAAGEAVRQSLNDWIRTGGAYDGVIDFDAAVHDPQRPTKFLATHQAGDYLHPNSTGYKAMAAAVDLKLLERAKR
jgi:GDSL-like Lipase/Acylhydrolase family